MVGLSNRVEVADSIFIELEDIAIQFIQSEQQRKKLSGECETIVKELMFMSLELLGRGERKSRTE